jgi:hypothetical protein
MKHLPTGLRSPTRKETPWTLRKSAIGHPTRLYFIHAVKAPNFGLLGNFGPLFQKGLLSLKRVLQKNKENKSFIKMLGLQVRFFSFFVHDSSTEATELARKSPKFP